MLLSDLIQSFLAAYQGRDASISGRLHYWQDTIGHVEVNDLTADLLDAELVKLAQRGKLTKVDRQWIPSGKPMAPGSLNRYRAALGSVFKWAQSRRLLPRSWHSPLKDIPSEREAQGRLTFLTAEQVERLVAAARVAQWHKLPALILMAFVTGLRRGALMGLRWKDVDLDAGTATVERMKNGSSHVAVLSQAVIAELRRIGPGRPDQLVFESSKGNGRAHDYRHAYEKALKDAGLPRVVFHGLRHSTATHLAKNGVGLLQIADVMNHRNLNTTKRYAHLLIADRAAVVQQHFAACGSGV